jgi:hypothetical protein
MINRSPARWGTTVFAAIAFTSMSSSAALAERPMPIPRNAVAASRAASPEARAHVRELYAGTPLRFERTVSRGGGHEEFIARGAGYAMALSPARVDVVLRNDPEQQAATFGMRLIDGSPRATAITRRLLPGVTNYVVGRDAHQWRTGVQGYSGVEYGDVYPGVNVVYYGNQQQLEYDFVIAPGANYKRIALAFDGVSAVRIDAAGNLVVATPAGDLMQRAPVIYQETATGRREIAGGYVRRDARRFGFWVGAHDPRLPLVIDPVLTYASYLGGSKDERAGGAAVDAEGNIYITGMTGAADFPIAAPAGLLHGRDNWDAFVVKLNPAGDQMIYATYIGGSSFDEPADLAVDASGNAYVIGSTGSSDFPTVHGIQSSLNGYDDAFIVKLNAAGAVAYSTYLGGSQDESGTGLAVDASGRAYVTGATFSANFPTVNAVAPRWRSGRRAKPSSPARRDRRISPCVMRCNRRSAAESPTRSSSASMPAASSSTRPILEGVRTITAARWPSIQRAPRSSSGLLRRATFRRAIRCRRQRPMAQTSSLRGSSRTRCRRRSR